MNTANGVSAERIVKALTSGRFAERLEAQKLLEDLTASFDRNAVRNELLRLLKEDYSGGVLCLHRRSACGSSRLPSDTVGQVEFIP